MEKEDKAAQLDKASILSKIEASRKGKFIYFLLSLIFGLAIMGTGIAFWIIGISSNNADYAMIGGLTVVPGLLLIALAGFFRNKYQKTVRSILTQAVGTAVFPDSQFDAKRGFSEEEVLDSGFFNAPDRFDSSDHLLATYKGIPFDQCHFRLEKRVSSKNGSTWDTYGEGTIYRFAFTRSFDARIKVMEEINSKNSQGLASLNQIRYEELGLEKIDTEYIAFNRKFDVFSTDKTSAFYLLTPQMQEKIMEMEGKFKGAFYLSLKKDHLYIVVNNSDSSFKLPLIRKTTEKDLDPIIYLLSIPALFVDELHLDSYKYKAEDKI